MAPEQLISAIRAALDETERIARVIAPRWASVTAPDPDGGVAELRADPAAVLRRVAADRELLAAWRDADALAKEPHGELVAATRYGIEIALRALARGLGINPETETPQ